MKKIFGIITILLAMICILVGCDPYFHVDVYIKNTTSQTITIQANCNTIDTLASFYNHENKIKVKSGETILLIQESEMGTFYKEDISWFMGNYYPNGIKIEFENGQSDIYHRDSADYEFNSPYSPTSYFFRFGEEYHEATYVIMR